MCFGFERLEVLASSSAKPSAKPSEHDSKVSGCACRSQEGTSCAVLKPSAAVHGACGQARGLGRVAPCCVQDGLLQREMDMPLPSQTGASRRELKAVAWLHVLREGMRADTCREQPRVGRGQMRSAGW